MLSEEKKPETDQSNNITRHNAIAISRDQQLRRSSFSLIQTWLQFFSIKIDGVTV